MSGNKKNIIVLMGGSSHEHGVSINSGKAVFENLNPKKYVRRAIVITRDNKVKILPQEQIPDNKLIEKTAATDFLSAFSNLKNWNVDTAVLALHGKGGEDGTIQGFLETIGIPYTHSGVLGSAISMNKIISRFIYQSNNIKIPQGIILRKNNSISKINFDFPMVAKPPQLGSSFGIKIVQNIEQLKSALNELWEIDTQILVEKFISGKEFTCVVYNKNNKIIPMPVTEIIPKKSDFFDFSAKYTAGATDEITPARIPTALSEKIKNIAAKCHEILYCNGVSRTDFILDNNDELFVLETNTIPGMTETSFVPKVARVAGMSFSEFLDQLIINAIRNS